MSHSPKQLIQSFRPTKHQERDETPQAAAEMEQAAGGLNSCVFWDDSRGCSRMIAGAKFCLFPCSEKAGITARTKGGKSFLNQSRTLTSAHLRICTSAWSLSKRFNWGHLSTGFHGAKRNITYTDAEISVIARNSFVCVEKWYTNCA